MVLESSTQSGRHGEAWAIQALTTPSRQLLAANWRWRRHEIDAVFMELDTVVFLEVKSRTGCGTNLRLDLHMPGAAQQKRIVKAANAFMKRHGMHAMECRFDVAAVRVHPLNGQVAHFTHVPDAFDGTQALLPCAPGGRWRKMP